MPTMKQPTIKQPATERPTIEQLCADLQAEQDELDLLLAGLLPEDWHRPTPAAGWDILDSLSHLCFFEEAGVLSVTDEAAFLQQRDDLAVAYAAAGAGNTPDLALGRRGADPGWILRRWRAARAALIAAVLHTTDRSRERPLRLQWYGPPMSPGSFVSARLLETWAHGVDVRDALGRGHAFTPRLRHVCHIGFGARAFSFSNHGVDDPGDPVRLEVTTPAGEQWRWGPAGAPNRIAGPALDVALVFTQRRHRSRTAVHATGPVAERWLHIAQAFAGLPTVTPLDR